MCAIPVPVSNVIHTAHHSIYTRIHTRIHTPIHIHIRIRIHPQDTHPRAGEASHACAHQDGHKESAAAHTGAGQGAQGAQGAKEASSQQSQSSLSRAG